MSLFSVVALFLSLATYYISFKSFFSTYIYVKCYFTLYLCFVEQCFKCVEDRFFLPRSRCSNKIRKRKMQKSILLWVFDQCTCDLVSQQFFVCAIVVWLSSSCNCDHGIFDFAQKHFGGFKINEVIVWRKFSAFFAWFVLKLEFVSNFNESLQFKIQWLILVQCRHAVLINGTSSFIRQFFKFSLS